MKKTAVLVVLSSMFLISVTTGQERAENDLRVEAGQIPVFRTTVTERTTKAISYRNRSGATKIDFKGTSAMPRARGEAKVERKQGYIEIEVEYANLQPANTLGSEYLTYVLWAITPEGRTANLGEVLLNGTRSKLNVTTELQAFGLIVTAEPYYSVTRPSDLIVMENVVRPDTAGKIELIDAKYELLKRGEYRRLSNPLALTMDAKLPLELYEARNAVQIARSIGAERFATDTFRKAEESLAQAEAYQKRDAGKKPVTMTARATVQIAEDARAIAVKRQEEDALTAERQAAADRQSRAEAGKLTAEADRAAALAESERLTREKNAQAAASLSEAERLKRENDLRLAAAEKTTEQVKADSDAKLAAAAAEAERLKRENETQRLSAQNALDQAAKDKAQAEAEKAILRAQLLSQFNLILQTRDTARGLIVNMSDVLFDTAKSTLRPLAREKLARVAGSFASHSGLRLEVEGHTDSVGSDEYNQSLSEQRGLSVRDYLTKAGLDAASVTSKGLGKTQPVAGNDTADGRQKNRRVELVISGDVIGSSLIATPLPVR